MFTKRKSIVAHINNHGVILETLLFYPADHLLHAFIYSLKRFQILVVETIKWNRSMIHKIHTMPAVTLFSYPFRNIAIVYFRLWIGYLAISFAAVRGSDVHTRRANNRHRRIFSFMTFCWLKFCVNSFVRKVNKKGLHFIPGV